MVTILGIGLGIAVLVLVGLVVRMGGQGRELEELAAKVQKHETEAKEKEKSLKKAVEQLEQLKESEKELREKLSQEKKKYTKLREEAESDEKSKIEEEVEKLKRRAEQSEAEAASLKDQLKAERDKGSNKEREFQALERRVKELQEKASEKPQPKAQSSDSNATNKSGESEAKVKMLEEKLAAMKREIDAAKEREKKLRVRLEKERRVAMVAGLQRESYEDTIIELKRVRNELEADLKRAGVARSHAQHSEPQELAENNIDAEANPVSHQAEKPSEPSAGSVPEET